MILITGINGEMGNALVKKLHNSQSNNIIGLDIKSPNEDVKPFLHKYYVGDIRDKDLINKIFIENTICNFTANLTIFTYISITSNFSTW